VFTAEDIQEFELETFSEDQDVEEHPGVLIVGFTDEDFAEGDARRRHGGPFGRCGVPGGGRPGAFGGRIQR